MRKLFFILALLAFFTAHASYAADKHTSKGTSNSKVLTMRQIADQFLPSVVQITIKGRDGQVTALGSGFVTAHNLIATNIHIVHDATTVTVNFPNGHSVEAYGTAGSDKSSDLAILYANTGTAKPLPISSASAHIGDTVIALGSPEGLSGSMSTGIISGIRFLSGARVLQTTAPISHGSSGGPLLNASGEVIGITSFMMIDGQNLNFAYSSYYLKLLIPSRVLGYLPWNKNNWVPVETTIGLSIAFDALQFVAGKKSTDNNSSSADFVKIVFSSNGLKLPKNEETQAAVGYDVPIKDCSQWACGDRLYFAFHHPKIDHTGIYIGSRMFVHPSINQEHKIVTDDINEADFASHLVCVRRSPELVGEPTQIDSGKH